MAQSTFAEVNKDGTVERVIVVTQQVINSGLFGDPGNWVQTNIDTRAGVNTKGELPLRKNYAGIGYKYDFNLDAFIPPQQFDSWVIDEVKGQYIAPKEAPKDGKGYTWNEKTLDWVALDNAVDVLGIDTI